MTDDHENNTPAAIAERINRAARGDVPTLTNRKAEAAFSSIAGNEFVLREYNQARARVAELKLVVTALSGALVDYRWDDAEKHLAEVERLCAKLKNGP